MCYLGEPLADLDVRADGNHRRGRGALCVRGCCDEHHQGNCCIQPANGSHLVSLPESRVVGKSDDIGAYPVERPVKPSEIVATIYNSLGVDLTTELPGPGGRP